mgnify:FL=1
MVSLMDLVPKKHKFELGRVQSNPYHRVFKPMEEQDDSGLVGDDHEQVELFGFHTKNYDICQSAVKAINILKKARMTERSKEILIQLVKIQDDFFGIEKKALKEEKITEEDLKGMINRLNEIHHRVGMLSARFKSDLRKHFTYTTMHIMSMLPYYEN